MANFFLSSAIYFAASSVLPYLESETKIVLTIEADLPSTLYEFAFCLRPFAAALLSR